jgi:hypothetical protein
MERILGNAPTSTRWQRVVIPLYDTRIFIGRKPENRTPLSAPQTQPMTQPLRFRFIWYSL